MQPIEDLAAKLKKVVRADKEVLLAYLFGSRGEGRVAKHSDVDIAILHCGDELMKAGEVKEKAARELKLDEDRIDVVDISKAPLTLKLSIVKGLKLIDRGNYEKALIDELNKKFPETRIIINSSVREAIECNAFSLRRDVLYSRLQKVREEATYLKEEILVRGVEAVVLDGTTRRAMARSIHELIEAMLDICRHLVSVKALGPTETYTDFPRLLSEHNLIPPSLAEALEEVARLRNVLVHRYIEVDYGRLLSKAREIIDRVVPKFEEWVLGLLRESK
ncbi:MAG: Nucleotidyltransferase domain protein [Candidatus Bathyarchaeota archaeon BA2]|nr:MAG: Nucleotidyltransferase domain protein [Candidatus Bathyarchaeota archaeon BA2]